MYAYVCVYVAYVKGTCAYVCENRRERGEERKKEREKKKDVLSVCPAKESERVTTVITEAT